MNKECIKDAFLNDELNTIEWANGFDFCPNLMQLSYATSIIE